MLREFDADFVECGIEWLCKCPGPSSKLLGSMRPSEQPETLAISLLFGVGVAVG